MALVKQLVKATACGFILTPRCTFNHMLAQRGVNNDFLVKSSDPLAVLYNDASPLENHHVSEQGSSSHTTAIILCRQAVSVDHVLESDFNEVEPHATTHTSMHTVPDLLCSVRRFLRRSCLCVMNTLPSSLVPPKG